MTLPWRFNLWMFSPYFAMALGWVHFRSPWIAVALFHGGMLAALLLHWKRWDYRILLRGGGQLGIVSVAAATLTFGFLFFYYLAHSKSGKTTLLANFDEFGLTSGGVMFLAIYFCLSNPVLEEAFWRGLFGSSHRRVTLSDLAYGGFHFLIALPFVETIEAGIVVLFLVGMGYLWRQISVRTGGLRLPVIWHALGDIAVIVTPAAVLWLN